LLSSTISEMGALLLAEHSVGATLTETATAEVDKSATSLQLRAFCNNGTVLSSNFLSLVEKIS